MLEVTVWNLTDDSGNNYVQAALDVPFFYWN
jgi:uncharacterized protein (DUF736 family)